MIRYVSAHFEQVVTRVIMMFVSVVIVYTLILVGIELVTDFLLGPDFVEKELLKDIFGSILTILILLEFNHSIAVALAGCASGRRPPHSRRQSGSGHNDITLCVRAINPIPRRTPPPPMRRDIRAKHRVDPVLHRLQVPGARNGRKLCF